MITRQRLLELLEMARLPAPESETAGLVADLQALLEAFGALADVPAEDLLEDSTHPLDQAPPLAADEPRVDAELAARLVAAACKRDGSGHLIVPRMQR